MTWAINETVGDAWHAGRTPASVIRSLDAGSGVSTPSGVGYTGNVWISDTDQRPQRRVHRRRHPRPVAAGPPRGSATSRRHGLRLGPRPACARSTSAATTASTAGTRTRASVVDSITGAFPWTEISQRGLAYRADDDTFYIGGWTEGSSTSVKGLSSPGQGRGHLRSAPHADGAISGLAYNAAANIVVGGHRQPDRHHLPARPRRLHRARHPRPPEPQAPTGAGLEMDEAGQPVDWSTRTPTRAYLIDSGVPAFQDVPWLGCDAGQRHVGARRLAVDRGSGRHHRPRRLASTRPCSSSPTPDASPLLRVPGQLVVPPTTRPSRPVAAIHRHARRPWAADQRLQRGELGLHGNLPGAEHPGADRRHQRPRPLPDATRRTLRVPLRQRARPACTRSTCASPSSRTEDRTAPVRRDRRGHHRCCPAHDIACEVGTLTADQHVFFVPVTDGQLNVRFVTRRGFAQPIVNAIQVVHRPDH